MAEGQGEGPNLTEPKSLITNNEIGLDLDGIALREGAGDSIQRRAIAKFSYVQLNDDELELIVGDVIEILGQEEEGWWRGKLKGKIGVFPSNYVSILGLESMEENSNDVKDRPEDKALEETPKNESGDEKLKSDIDVSDDQSAKKVQADLTEGTPPKKDQPDTNHDSQSNPNNGTPSKKVYGFGNIFGGSIDRKISPVRSISKNGDGKNSIKEVDSIDNDQVKEGESAKEITVNKKVGTFVFASPAANDVKILSHSSKKTNEYAKAHEPEKDDQSTLHIGNVVNVLSKEVDKNAEEAEKLTTTTAPHLPAKPPALPAKPAKPPKLFRPAVPVLPTPSISESAKMNSVESKVDSPSIPVKETISLLKSFDENHAEKNVAAPVSPSPTKKPGRIDFTKIPDVLKHNRFFSREKSREKSPAKGDEKLSTMASGTKGEFEGTSTEQESLAHLTVNRPKNPHKRPPSQSFLKEMAVAQPAIIPVAMTTNVSPQLSQKAQPILPPKKPPPPKSPKLDFKTNGKLLPELPKVEYVRKEEFDKLLAEFDAFRRDSEERIKELEKRIAENAEKSQKL